MVVAVFAGLAHLKVGRSLVVVLAVLPPVQRPDLGVKSGRRERTAGRGRVGRPRVLVVMHRGQILDDGAGRLVALPVTPDHVPDLGVEEAVG